MSRHEAKPTDLNIQAGDVIEGPQWNEPVEVIKVEERGNDALALSVYGTRSEHFSQKVIKIQDLQGDNVSIRKEGERPRFDADPTQFHVAVEAERIKRAAEYDTHHALTTSQVDPVPHQLEAVYGYMLPEYFSDNRVKFFLADDAGAGKTIMGGLLLKELKQRGIIENALILAPAKLQRQWQKELDRLFDERYRIIRRSEIDHSLDNPWEEHQYCITSMAFSIQDDVKESLRNVQWDMVVVDEAHHLSAYRYGADEEEQRTERYKVGELLRENSLHRLLLSATPHKGRRDHFQLLLRLLDNDLFAEDELPREIIHSDEPGTVFLRRMKEDMMDLHGNKLFNDRNVHTVSYELTGPEFRFYKDVTEYVEEQFQTAWKEDNRHVEFALIILQRRVASSVRAARKSLQRRREGLRELLEDVDKLREVDPVTVDQETLEEMAERQRWEIEEEALRRLTMASNHQQLQNEMNTLEQLIEQAKYLEANHEDHKLAELHRVLRRDREDTPFGPDEKVVIFTEAKDTLDLLTENLGQWGYDYVTIHGGMRTGQTKNPGDGTRLWAEEQFNDPDGPQILVATDAAGEGINLHKQCRLMINYDIPWNPTWLEQRMGRIHRYGQHDQVHIYNLVAVNTREGGVLQTLSEKLEVMREDIGSDRVFDVINDLFQDVRLDDLIRDVVSGTIDQETAEVQLEQIEHSAEEAVRRASEQGLATRHVDLAQVQEWLKREDERRLTPEYIEKFFVTAFDLLGGTIEQRRDGFWRIEWVPAAIRRVAQEHQFNEPDTAYTKFTFYKDETDEYDAAEFVSPGHPLFEAVKHKAEGEFSETLPHGAAYLDPDAESPYALWFIKQELEDGNGETVGNRVFCVRQRDENTFGKVSEAILHDLNPITDQELDRVEEAIDDELDRKPTLNWFYSNVATEYQSEVREDKQQVVQTVRPSMKKALQSAIVELGNDIREFERKAEEEHADMKRAIENKKRKRENLKERRDEQLQRLERATQIDPVDPSILGTAVVLPPATEEEREAKGGMTRDEEIEQVGMEVSMEYEREHGREPEDVAAENLGFDVRSYDRDKTGIIERRCIEVKARAKGGAVRLTENEWTMASRLSDEFWLYIVTEAGTDDPQLHIINDPESRLDPDRTEVRYFIGQDSWQSESEVVDV